MKNRIEVEGYLAAKPERRLLPSGITVANARLGETYMIHRGNGKLPEKHTNWHGLSFYGEDSTAAASLEKGAHLFVVGTYENREWTGKDGSKRAVWELNVSSFHVIGPLPGKPIETKPEGASDETWPA